MKSEFVKSTRVVCTICVVLVKSEGPVAHYLEKTRHIFCHAIHVLCSVYTLVLLMVLLQIKNILS
jgi:hypothetical protein